MQRFHYPTILLWFLLSLLFTSCGGDSIPELSVSSDEIDGLWSGSVIDDGIAHSFVLGLSDTDDNLNIILDSSGNATLAGLAIFFDGEVSDSSEMTLYDISGDFVDDLEFVQGSFDPETSLTAELTNASGSRIVTVDLIYNAFRYERPSSLTLVSGTWRFNDGLNTLDLEIDAGQRRSDRVGHIEVAWNTHGQVKGFFDVRSHCVGGSSHCYRALGGDLVSLQNVVHGVYGAGVHLIDEPGGCFGNDPA